MTLSLSDLLRQDNRRRVILVELDYVAEVAGAPATQTLYLANSTAPLQADDAIIYEDCVNSVPNFQRSLSGPISTVYSSSLGSIEIDNADGEKDFLLSAALDGSQARFYVWDAGTTYLVFVALCLRASAPSFDRISIALKDAGVLLNKSVGGTDLIGGTGPNADRWRPVNFGYVHNLDAKISDNAALIYVHSDTGTNTAAVDVRDRGVSVLFTDLADGTFQLPASPAGIITCDVVASYDGTDATRRVSDLLTFLVQDRLSANAGEGFVGAGPTFTVGDADDYLIGISIPDARNIVDVLNQVCDSGNCFWAILRTGEFTFGRLRPNSIGDFGFITATIIEDDYDEGSWHIEHDPPLYYLLQAYMSRNWYSQTDFAGLLTPDEQAVFTRPGIFLLQDTSVGTAYADIPEAYDKTLSISPAIDTILSGAFGELDLPYLADWMETRRFMQLPWIERLSMTVGLEFYFLELGDPVAVKTPRYGMDTGELFQVISININLTQAKIDLILLRRHTAEPLPPGWIRITAAAEGGPPVARAYHQLIKLIPPVDHPCGTPYFVGGDMVFIPCPGGGGGGGGGVTVYTFDIGGVLIGDVIVVSDFFFDDFGHSPAWWDLSAPNVLVHEDVADDAGGNVGAIVDVLFRPRVTDLAYPGHYVDNSALSRIAFFDGSTWAGDGTTIDYTSINGAPIAARDIVAPGPYSPGTDDTLGTFEFQWWMNYPLHSGEVAVAAVILAGVLWPSTGHLLVTIQNDSGSTVTDLDNGAAGSILINLPSNAVDPDAPADGELDVSFVGGAPTCLRDTTGGATISVAGDRHELQISISGLSIVDGDKVQLIFPVTLSKGGDNGWLGFTNTGSWYARPVPTFTTSVASAPAATVKLFTDVADLLFAPNN